jgi:hypothetical protein
MQISNDDVKNLKFINKQDTDKLIVSVMADSDTIRPTYILKRGVTIPMAMKLPGTPKSILPFTGNYPKTGSVWPNGFSIKTTRLPQGYL